MNKECTWCGGSGKRHIVGVKSTSHKCPYCKGTGKTPVLKCYR